MTEWRDSLLHGAHAAQLSQTAFTFKTLCQGSCLTEATPSDSMVARSSLGYHIGAI